MSQLKRLFRETAIYGASSIFGRAINFLLVPLYTAVFSPAEYGVVTELYAYVAFFMVIYLFGIETTFFRFATKHNDTPRYFNLSLTNAILSATILSGILIAFSQPITGFLEYPEAGKYVVWLALILALDTLVAVPFARLRLERKAKKFALYKISNILVNIGLNLVFLVLAPRLGWDIPDLGVGYVFLSNLVASAFTALLFLPDFLSYRPVLDKVRWSEMLSYAGPLVIIGLAGVTNEMLSRALLRHWLPEGFYPGLSNLAALGIFGACYKLSMLMNLSVQSFRYAYEPFFFSKADEKGSPELFANVMNAFIIYGCIAFIGISLILPEVAPLILRRSDYLKALHVVPLLLLSGLFLGIFYNLSVWYKLIDKTKYGAVITVIGAVLTVVLNVLLIPILGYEGSALATFAVYLAMVIISYAWGQKHYFIPYKLGRGLLYLAISSLIVWCFYFLQFGLMTKYLFGGGALVFFVILVFVLERGKERQTE